MVGRFSCTNEAGLATDLTASPACPHDQPDVMVHLAIQWTFDNCTSIEEAIKFMQRIPDVRANNHLVAESEGEMSCIQAAPRGTGVCQNLMRNGTRFAKIYSSTHELDTRKLHLADGVQSEIDCMKYFY